MKRHALLSGCAAVGLFATATPLFAHHGTAGSYDQAKTVTLDGIVKGFEWRNPHTVLFVASKDASGNEQTYALQGSSPESLVKSGFSRTSFKAGDKIIVKMHPGYQDPLVGEFLEDLFWLNGKEMRNANVGQSSKDNGTYSKDKPQ